MEIPYDEPVGALARSFTEPPPFCHASKAKSAALMIGLVVSEVAAK